MVLWWPWKINFTFGAVVDSTVAIIDSTIVQASIRHLLAVKSRIVDRRIDDYRITSIQAPGRKVKLFFRWPTKAYLFFLIIVRAGLKWPVSWKYRWPVHGVIYSPPCLLSHILLLFSCQVILFLLYCFDKFYYFDNYYHQNLFSRLLYFPWSTIFIMLTKIMKTRGWNLTRWWKTYHATKIRPFIFLFWTVRWLCVWIDHLIADLGWQKCKHVLGTIPI